MSSDRTLVSRYYLWLSTCLLSLFQLSCIQDRATVQMERNSLGLYKCLTFECISRANLDSLSVPYAKGTLYVEMIGDLTAKYHVESARQLIGATLEVPAKFTTQSQSAIDSTLRSRFDLRRTAAQVDGEYIYVHDKERKTVFVQPAPIADTVITLKVYL